MPYRRVDMQQRYLENCSEDTQLVIDDIVATLEIFGIDRKIETHDSKNPDISYFSTYVENSSLGIF